MNEVLLVPGGLAGEATASWFWEAPGVVADLGAAGCHAVLTERDPRAKSWRADAAFVARRAASLVGPLKVLAGSNGCSTALRLVLDQALPIEGMVLAWPATAGDPEVDAATRRSLAGKVHADAVETLLAGDPVRGVTAAELASVDIPVTIVPIRPEDPWHQHRTVEALAAALPHVHVSEATAATPSPGFASDRGRFARIAIDALGGS